jgi:hypothetical protein
MTNSGDEKNLQPMYVNTSAPDDGNLSPGESESPVTMENGKVVIRKHRKNITYPDIAQCFDMPIRDAAQILGISLTQLKRLCREFNIPRWPYRRLNSIQRRIEVLTIMLERNNQTGGDDRTARDTRDEMRKLQEEARSIKEDPTIVTKQGLDIDGCSSSTFTIQNDNTPNTQYNMMTGQLQMYGDKNDFDDMMGKQGQRLVVKYPGAKDSPASKKRKNTSTKGGKKKKAKNVKEEDDDDEDNFDDTPKQQQMQQPSPIMQSLQQPSQNQNQQYQDSTQPPLIMMIDPLYNPNITSSRRRQAPTPTPPMHPQQQQQQIKRQSPPTPPVNMIPNQQPQRITTSMGPRLSENSLLSFMNSNNGSTGSIGMHMNNDRIPSPPRLTQQQYNNQQMMNRNNGYNNMGMLPSLQNPNYEEQQQFQQPSEGAQNGYLPNQLLRFDVASVQDMDNSARRDSTDGDILRKFSVSSLFDRRQSSIGDLFSSDDATPSSANLTSQQDSVGSVGSLLSPMRGSSVGTFDSGATQSDGTDLMRVLQQNYGPPYNNGSFFPQATQAAPDNSRFHTS